MEYTKPKTTGTAPSNRSWHGAVKLPGNKMFINGGYNGIKTLTDAFLLDLGELRITQYILLPVEMFNQFNNAP
jgi:hypothetical protein